jgi:hypothetical protein
LYHGEDLAEKLRYFSYSFWETEVKLQRKSIAAAHFCVVILHILVCWNFNPDMLNSLVTVGFEIFSAVVVKSSFLWDITPCSPLKVSQHFKGTCRPYLQGQIISQARNQSIALLAPCLHAGI